MEAAKMFVIQIHSCTPSHCFCVHFSVYLWFSVKYVSSSLPSLLLLQCFVTLIWPAMPFNLPQTRSASMETKAFYHLLLSCGLYSLLSLSVAEHWWKGVTLKNLTHKMHLAMQPLAFYTTDRSHLVTALIIHSATTLTLFKSYPWRKNRVSYTRITL